MIGWSVKRYCFALVVAGAVLALAPNRACPAETTGPRIASPIVFVQLPVGLDIERQPALGGGMLRANYGDGGRIVRRDLSGRVVVLTEGFDSACGLDVSFDATHILFAAKRTSQDTWNIWEMNADGSDARQITRDLGNCRSPAYQASFYTIDSTQPWFQIMFVSDAAGALNEYGTNLATSLYSCRLDGSGVRRLTMNLSADLDPFLMSDGRALLASWQRMDLRRGPRGRVALFGVNTDGTDYALYLGEQGLRIKHMPCETTDGLVVLVESDRVGWDGAGALASVTLRRHFYSHRTIVQDPSWKFHSPSPLAGGHVLVSARSAAKGMTHGIYRLDPRTGHQEIIFDDPQYHDLHAKILAPRPRPDGRSSVVNEEFATGKLYCLNAYTTTPADREHLPPGVIKRLRVIEGVPERPRRSGAGSQPNGHNIVIRKRLLGEVSVEEDGSFQIEVPPDTPIQLQTLDDNGMALKTCGWIWVKHREARGCIGCHEDPELTPENRFVAALGKPAIVLTPEPGARRSVDFEKDVAPILAGKCATCHDGQSGGLDLRGGGSAPINPAFGSLTADLVETGAKDSSIVGKYIHPGQARTSGMVWRLFGANTSRPWDSAYNPKETFPTCPPKDAAQLTNEEKLTLIEWIDLGAIWSGIPAAATDVSSDRSDGKSEGAP